jgi:hypothetical protein
VTPAERRQRFTAALRKRLRADAAAIDEDVLRVVGTLAELQADLRNRIAAVDASDFTTSSLPGLLQEVDRQLERWVGRAKGEAAGAIEGAWTRGPQLIAEPLRAAGAELGRFVIPDSLLDAAKDFTADRIGGLKDAARRRIESNLRLMVLGGQTPSQAMLAIGSDVNKGPLKTISLRAESIVRTEGGRIYSESGQRRLVAAADDVKGLQKQWLRGKSRPNHAIDQVRDVTGKYTLVNGVELMYPREAGAPVGEVVNCACQSVPYMASW